VAKRRTGTERAIAAPAKPEAPEAIAAAEAITTFPPNECSGGLPAGESFHDVTFAEFKRLNRTIDDLPLPIVFGTFDYERYRRNIKKGGGGKSMVGNLRKAGNTADGSEPSQSLLEFTGGIPVGRQFDASLSDLEQPVFHDVHASDVMKVIASEKVAVGPLKNQVARLALTDADRADLLSQLPVFTEAKVGNRSVVLRILPQDPRNQKPLQSEYTVHSVADFVRTPYVRAVDGSFMRVELDAAQIKDMTQTGQAKLVLGGSKVSIRVDFSAGAGAPDGQGAVFSKIKDGGLRSDGTQTRDTGGTRQGAGAGVPKDRTDTPASSAPPPAPAGSSAGSSGCPPARPRQAALPLALYLPWRHRWVLKGYSRGELLHSLALGPQEDVTIEISTWDRRKRTFEDSAKSEFEQTSEFTETDKDVQSVAREVSNQSELGLTIGAEVGVKVEVVNFSGSSTANARTAIANSSKNNLEILKESVRKASNKLKLQRETKISEATETGIDSKVTRKVRNPNLCHTLTLNYFEVLAHYEIVTEFNREDARLCVLDANPVQAEDFTYRNIRYYESILRRVLLVPELAHGFEAARKLFAQDQMLEARQRNQLNSAAANVLNVAAPEQDKVVVQANRVLAAYAQLSVTRLAVRVEPTLWMAFVPWPVMTLVLLDSGEVQRYMFLRRARAIAPTLFDVLRGFDGSTSADASGAQALAEAIGGMALGTISTGAIGQDKDAMYAVLRSDLDIASPVVFTDIPPDTYAVNDAGLVAALSTFAECIRSAVESKAAEAGKAAMEANQASVQSDYSDKEIAEALESVEALATHLNRYRNYYRTAILTLMPFPDEFQNRLTMLPQVERRVLGFDNHEIALPINAALDTRTQVLFDELVTNNKDLLSTSTRQSVTLPTSGVHVETRLGDCSACEDYLVDLRRLDLRAKDADIDLKRETLAQQKLETQRMQARLDEGDLGDPVCRPAVLKVETVAIQGPKAADDVGLPA
jgi:hypothetical protein